MLHWFSTDDSLHSHDCLAVKADHGDILTDAIVCVRVMNGLGRSVRLVAIDETD